MKKLNNFQKRNRNSVLKAVGLKKDDPGPTPEQLALEQQQRVDQATLDKQENERRKRLFAATQGLRMFRGSAASRTLPSNTATAQAAPASPGNLFSPGGSMFNGFGL